jgi:hypothetical protein
LRLGPVLDAVRGTPRGERRAAPGRPRAIHTSPGGPERRQELALGQIAAGDEYSRRPSQTLGVHAQRAATQLTHLLWISQGREAVLMAGESLP